MNGEPYNQQKVSAIHKVGSAEDATNHTERQTRRHPHQEAEKFLKLKYLKKHET